MTGGERCGMAGPVLLHQPMGEQLPEYGGCFFIKIDVTVDITMKRVYLIKKESYDPYPGGCGKI